MQQETNEEAVRQKLENIQDKLEFSDPDRLKIISASLLAIFIALVLTVVPQLGHQSTDVVVEVTETSLEPARPSVSSGEEVKFSNKADKTMSFSFERGIDSFELESGESRTENIGMTVYYTATPVQADSSQKIRGSIVVQ